MNFFSSLVSLKSSLFPHSAGFPAVARKAILLVASTITSLTSSLAAGASSPVPPGYSSEIVHVKFRVVSPVYAPDAALPPYLADSVAEMRRLFSLSEQKLEEVQAIGESRSSHMLPGLHMWFQITLKPGTNAADYIEDMKRLSGVEIVEPALLPSLPPAITPNFTGEQGYLDTATDGIDARFAWTVPGGSGTGVKLYDIEYSWNQTHEDLSKANGILLLLNPGDSAVDPFSDNNHGTAVLG